MNAPTRKGRITIQAVAEHAGVSAMTVSNVINQTGRVGEATRTRVRAAIKALGYVPNLTAQRLVGARPTRLGLIYRDVESVFVSSTLAAVSVEAAARGLQLLLRADEGLSRERLASAVVDLMRSGAEALLLMPPFAEMLSGTAFLQSLDAPVAAIATAAPLPDMATVRMDNVSAARAVTELLIGKGHRRIGLIAGPPQHSDSLARVEGHRAALRAHGLTPSADLDVAGAFSFASGLDAAERLLDLHPPPTAIVAANDDMAAGALWAAHRRGLDLPRDLAVTGFDDTLIATRVWPALTTVRQPVSAMAGHAIDLLTRAPPTQGPREAQDAVLEFTLIERAST
jgi:LacI family transcriptional regulator